MISEKLYKRYYPDLKHDGTRKFYGWIREYTNPNMTLLNLGAGPATKKSIRIFKGEVASVIGADIDPVVLSNEELDEGYLIKDGVLPFSDNYFDLAYSDFVLEHIEDPKQFLQEVYRVLKPGGSFFFRAPNKYHYVAIIARSTPHWFHDLVANRVRGLSEDSHEPWPTFYRLNSQGLIQRYANQVGFEHIELRFVEAEPSYFMFHAIPFMLGVAYERLVNRFDILSGIRVNIFGRLVK